MKEKISNIIINNTIVSVINLIFAGVIIACWLIPLAERHSHEKEVYYNKRIELANNFIIDFSQYRLNRQRLILVGMEEVKGANRMARDSYRDKVYRDIQLAMLFFSPAVVNEGKTFIAWDSLYATKAYKPPNDSEMENWQNKISKLMEHELKA